MPQFHPEYTTPLTWSPLWDAIRDEYHNAHVESREPRLILTTDAMAEEMLCAVPPRCQHSDGFLVGEANHHNNDGRAVYSAFVRLGKTWGCRYATAQEFRSI